ncbi:MAG: RNA-binding protein, partial [Bacteroidota bacterium]
NIDPIICFYIQGKSYPMTSRDELLDQIPMMRKKYVKYATYADATMETIFTKEQLAKAGVLTCTTTESIVLINNSQLSFTKKHLPIEAQFSKSQSILADDYDADGHTDLILLGNFFSYRTQLGESDASYGLFLKGNGKGDFTPMTPEATGLFADGDVRAAVVIKDRQGQRKIVVAKNNDVPQTISIH